jgi:hypothetical protein
MDFIMSFCHLGDFFLFHKRERYITEKPFEYSNVLETAGAHDRVVG